MQEEEDDDGVLSGKSERKDYENLMKATERTGSIYKIGDSEDEIKNEKNSADFTVKNIQVSSEIIES